ncbi:Concanavalin A-like lectin/glucanase, subgroup [Artemisia annua]|uniref:Concanavalin A-like lectin/glucanase, subgroup n=1 Tax=Artemisia annua TaxID=35608 RepID=A0A2U1KZF0_ARTAN|nr:Concanavalin A-like lectin/glucanase, subgroup [Artemisia annua]
MRYSETPFFQDNQTTSIVPYLSKGSSGRLGMIIGASIGVVIVLFILALSLWYKSRKRPKADEENSQFAGVKSYRYNDLQSATHDFSEEYRIGKGGYGEVFKAILDNENVVAVKKLRVLGGKAEIEFSNEVKLISNVRHRNLMQLLGWSTNGSELLLVLEYMPQGSLDKFLWGEKRGTLNWKQRFDIIFGIAKGLAHLHEEFYVKIVHRDIKSSNILLDDDFQPKIADFGLARFQPEDKSHVSTRFAGTLGYTAPEYATYGHLSEKVDTYSFGIVALEIISGRRCNDVSFDGYGNHYLLQHAWELYEKGIHIQLIDEALNLKESEKEHVMKITEIALMCAQSPANFRPAMSEVLLMLSSGPSLKREQITKPTFIDYDKRVHLEIK